MIIEWFDDHHVVTVVREAAPPLGVDTDIRRRWYKSSKWRTQPGRRAFCVHGTARTKSGGYDHSGQWWIVRVSPPDDITPAELETLKASMLDMVRLRYGWTE